MWLTRQVKPALLGGSFLTGWIWKPKPSPKLCPQLVTWSQLLNSKMATGGDEAEGGLDEGGHGVPGAKLTLRAGEGLR